MRILLTYPKGMDYTHTPAYNPLQDYDFTPVPNVRGGYYDILFSMWNLPDDYLIVEHDKVATKEVLDGIINCDEPLCVARYKYHPDSLRPNVQYVQRVMTDVKKQKTRDVLPDDIYCDTYGFGMIKITKGVIRKVDLPRMLNNRTIIGVDTQLSIITMNTGYRAHLHPEIEHRHQ